MLNQLFNSIYSSMEVKINPLALIFSLATSVVLGIILAKVYKRQTIYTCLLYTSPSPRDRG